VGEVLWAHAAEAKNSRQKRKGKAMPTSVDISSEGPILRVSVVGTVNPGLGGADLAVLDRILAACTEHQSTGILFDLSLATVEVNAVDMYHVGAALAKQMTPGVKMAVYYNADNTKENPFFKVITQNRGVLYRAFSDENEALNWLNQVR
jgi:hypothetical protein